MFSFKEMAPGLRWAKGRKSSGERSLRTKAGRSGWSEGTALK